jgi:hypothetical protein
MDSRRSIYSCRGAGRGRCRVGLGAAGKTPVEVGAPVPVHSVGEGDLRNGRRKSVGFCGKTILRIRLDEEVFYPAALFIRNYLRLRARKESIEGTSSSELAL